MNSKNQNSELPVNYVTADNGLGINLNFHAGEYNDEVSVEN